MRSFAPLAVLVLSSSVLPTLAAPHGAHQYKREDATSALLARQTQSAQPPAAPATVTDESGALWGALFKLIPTAVSALSGLFGNNKRELVDILARDQLLASEMLRRGIDYEDLVARADATNDESGAFLGMLLKAVPAFLGLFGNHKRDFNELLARSDLDEHFVRELIARADAGDDQSGAFFGMLLKAVPAFLSLFGNHKRDFDELLARGDLDEHFVRELIARADAGDDESGAFLGMLLKAVPAFLGLFGNHKREFEDVLFARGLSSLNDLD